MCSEGKSHSRIPGRVFDMFIGDAKWHFMIKVGEE
jgi:hypothetical protein